MAQVLVLVPTHGHQETLLASVESALRQTFTDFELVVVGDGAPDRTREIVAGLAARDPRVRGVFHPKGPGHGEPYRDQVLRDRGAAVVAYLADDDLWLPHHLATMVAALARADLAQSAQVETELDGTCWARLATLASPPLRRLVATRQGNFFGLACTAHTMAAYRRLAVGWEPGPPGVFSDLHLWAKLLADPAAPAVTVLEPTVLRFRADERRADPPAERLAELRTWLALSGEPGFAARLAARLFWDPDDLLAALEGSRPDGLDPLLRLHRIEPLPPVGPILPPDPAAPGPVRLGPDQRQALELALGQHLGALSPESAQAGWERALAARPDCGRTRSRLAGVLGARQAYAALEALAATPSPRATPIDRVLCRVHGLFGLGEPGEAAQVLEERLARSPGHPGLQAAARAAARALEEAGPALRGPPPPAQGRSFRVGLDPGLRERLQEAKGRTLYRGLSFKKAPFDVVLYMQLVGRLRPRTVLELGTGGGGAAVWFADLLEAHRVEDPRVVTVDHLPAPGLADPRITVRLGDLADLPGLFPPDLLADLPRPWLVIDDGSHTYRHVLAALGFFDAHLHAGDYLVVEDGIIGELVAPTAIAKGGGPSRAVSDFLARHPGRYRIDAELCDFFGQNLTWSPNGWLRRV